MKPMLLLVSAILLTLIFLLRSRIMVGALNRNVAFALLSDALSASDEAQESGRAQQAEAYLVRAARAGYESDPLTSRGLGLSLGLQNDRVQAQLVLDSLGTMAAVNYTLLGDAANRFGHHEIALFWYKHAVERDPHEYSAWMKLGNLYEELGHIDEAINAYEQVWPSMPTMAFKPYVSALISRSMDGEAEEILQDTLNSDLEFHERLWGWLTLGQLMRDQERLEEAYEVYSTALGEYKNEASLLVNLGWLLYEQEGNRDAAVKQFETAITADSDLGDGYFAMGQLATQEKNYIEAEAWFELALEKNDSNPRWRLVRANTAREAGNIDLAESAYSDIIDRFPKYAPAYYELAEIYRELDSPEQALRVLNKGDANSPNPPLRYALSVAEIYVWAGQPKLAIEIYQNILEADPDNSDVLEQLRLLQND